MGEPDHATVASGSPPTADFDRAMIATTLLRNDFVNGLRYALAAPFSKVSAAKQRWRRERAEWEALGVAHTDMRRKTYVVPETGAVCITVSKCANTTLKFMLGPPEMKAAQGVHRNDHLLTRLIDQGLTLNDLLDGSYKVFTFVRHPVARFWSAYYSMVETSRPQISFVASIRSDLSKALGVPVSDHFAPELVLEYVRTTSPIDVDEHLRPQWSCTGIEKLPIAFVGRVETMAKDVTKLLEMGYLNRRHVERFGHLNRTEQRDIPDKARIDRTICDVYAKDLELLGYD